MEIFFSKYHGTGNDFILIDDRGLKFPSRNFPLIKNLCHRNFGVGADGLILLRNSAEYDFEMVYYNSDGNPGSMCGNGGRCITAFAKQCGIDKNNFSFIAPDGKHSSIIKENKMIGIQMLDLEKVEKGENYFFMDTGSPHYVTMVENLDELDVYAEGRKIRYNQRFSEYGTNVNFVEIKPDGIKVRTYERGVENETLSCGTGVTASAIASVIYGIKKNTGPIIVETKGGVLEVDFIEDNHFSNIWLWGPVEFVYKGSYSYEL